MISSRDMVKKQKRAIKIPLLSQERLRLQARQGAAIKK
jgi:hypothetical protein